MSKVKCPVCNARLFDVDETTIGGISIKCQKCRKVSYVFVQTGKVVNFEINPNPPIPSNGVNLTRCSY